MPEPEGDKRVIVLDRQLRMNYRPDANPYTAGEERAARELTPAEVFRQLAGEPHNAAVAEKIREIARKIDGRRLGVDGAKDERAEAETLRNS
jgi:hypothetical protein